jgi:hypothetical protein
MAADFSRVRNNPLLDYAAVELKQGGVLLDADANELAAILDRRLRALAGDVLGRATVGANTPDAFRITVDAGDLQIGRGRLYVDGLLAENHGAANPAQREFDDLMAETRFTADTPYAAQPYLPAPPSLPRAGRHLVYLDVWDRDVTHLENPDLVEIAVGVETSSRVQTVWQVRVLAEEAGNDITCGSPDAGIAGWLDLIAPSTGRLTTGTYDVSAVADPCELPPTGGYRGLENQLYRVEIHDPGQPGAGATFKWSRNNASVGVHVESVISATVLQLGSLGRDDVLRFATGDWVEITDDVVEFAQAAGEIRRITVDEANRRISFTPALPVAMLPATFPDSTFAAARHTRVKLWDQKQKVLSPSGNGDTTVFADLDAAGSTGVISMPAGGATLLLESGITVSFASTGAKGFRAGDYWVFAARTADASIEMLDQAPPRGIHHHYARLALWDAGTDAEPTDCRHPWPPRGGEDCSCTACVTPESHASGQLTIQDAVQRVQGTGGTVCLRAGQYALRAPVRIAGARSVRIKGQGPATVIAAPAGAFSIESSIGIVIEDLAVISLGRQPAVAVRTAAGLTLQQLVLLVVGNADAQGAAIALSGVVAGLAIRDNLIVAPEGIRALDPTAKDPLTFLITAAIGIETNILWCQRQAIDFAGMVGHLLGSRICGNEVLVCRDAGISVLGIAAPGASMRIAENRLSVNGPGIRCALDGAWIEGNKVEAAPRGGRQPTGSGISLLTGVDPTGSDQCQVLANQISGFPDSAILINAPIIDLIVKLNIIDRCGNGIVMIDAASAGSLSIENNHLRDIGTARDPKLGAFIMGIGVARAESATVAGNTLRRIGVHAPRGTALVVGVAHMTVRRSRITGNDVVEVGPAAELPGTIMAGILLLGPYVENDVCGNHVERDAEPGQPDATAWAAISANEPQAKQPIIHTGVFTAVRLNDTRTLVFHGTHAFINDATLVFDAAGAAVARGSSFGVRGNSLVARGAVPAVSVAAGADIQFVDNRCELIGRGNPAVLLLSTAAVVSANLVRGGETSIAASAPVNRATMVGNATTGMMTIGQQPLTGTPWEHLNVRI